MRKIEQRMVNAINNKVNYKVRKFATWYGTIIYCLKVTIAVSS